MPVEELVPRSKVAKEFGCCSRTIGRWEKAKIKGFDQPIKINDHVYHKRSRIEQAKVGGDALKAAGQ